MNVADMEKVPTACGLAGIRFEVDVFDNECGVPVLVQEPQRLMTALAHALRALRDLPRASRVYGPCCVSMDFFTSGPIDWSDAYWVASLVMAQLSDRGVVPSIDLSYVRTCQVGISRSIGRPRLQVVIAKLS